MIKTSELTAQLAELKHCGEALIGIADSLTKLFLQSAETEQEQVIPKEEKKLLSFEEVRAILATKSREGHTAEVKAILTEFGVEKLSDIDPSQYEELLKKVEVI